MTENNQRCNKEQALLSAPVGEWVLVNLRALPSFGCCCCCLFGFFRWYHLKPCTGSCLVAVFVQRKDMHQKEKKYDVPGTGQLYLRVSWTSAFRQFFLWCFNHLALSSQSMIFKRNIKSNRFCTTVCLIFPEITNPSSSNRPFYRYGGHIELIRFEEYYRMPRGHEHISFVFSSAFRDIFS